MSELSKRSTIYFEPDIHQALRMKAATAHISVSGVVNEAVRIALREDQEGLVFLRKEPMNQFQAMKNY